MRNVRSRDYLRLCAELPPSIQELASTAFRSFLSDPNHRALRRHPIANKQRLPSEICWSVSIGRRYRALYFVDGDVNVWFWIGSHEAYNNLIT